MVAITFLGMELSFLPITQAIIHPILTVTGLSGYVLCEVAVNGMILLKLYFLKKSKQFLKLKEQNFRHEILKIFAHLNVISSV